MKTSRQFRALPQRHRSTACAGRAEYAHGQPGSVTWTTSMATPSVQQLEGALDGTGEHRAVAALDDRTLHELRVLGHQADELVVGRRVVDEVELGGEGLAGAQHVARPGAGLAQQLAQLGLGQTLDVVLDPIEVDAALLQQLGQLAARRAGAFLVDGQLGHRGQGYDRAPMDDRLTLPPDELRRFGHRVVDLVVDHLAGLRDEPPVRTGDLAALEDLLREPPPEQPGDLDAALDLLARDVLSQMQHSDHPRYFARVPSPSNGVAALGDALAAGFNVFATSWSGGSGPTVLELVVVDWLRELCALPEGTEGVLLSGGSVSALTALAAARGERGGDVAYLSDQTHASNARALRILGVPHVRVLPSDDAFRLSPVTVRAPIAEDRAAGRAPFCVIATAGTTNTGAVDPLAELAALCRDEALWFHVDGAYGAPAALTPRGRALLDGLQEADSLCLDPHKWLFQPVEAGCLLVRRPGALARTFAMAPEYLRDVAGGGGNPRRPGPPPHPGPPAGEPGA